MANEPGFEQPLVTFQVITDTHVTAHPNHIHNRHFEQALMDLARIGEGSSGIMHVGDVTDGGMPGEYRELKRILERHGKALPEIRYAVGNHDIGAIVWQKPPLNLMEMSEEDVAALLDGTVEAGELTSAVEEADATNVSKLQLDAGSMNIAGLWGHRIHHYEAATGMKGSYHDHWIDGYHYIFLGSEQPHPKDCHMSDEQLKWLEDKLGERAEEERPIFVFLHQPLKNTVAGSMEEQGWYGVNQDEALKAVLAGFPQAILFSGHTHWQLEAPRTMYEGGDHMPTMFNASSVAYLWTDEDEHLEGSQGLHVEVYADRVVVKGRDFVKESWIEGAEFTVNYLSDSRL